jgi:hypothetical protein
VKGNLRDGFSVKKIGFLAFGHWTPSPQSGTRSASDALLQSIDLAVAAKELGADGAYFRVHHFARQLGSPFPLLAAVGARTNRIEIGTAVIDMRYENPFYMAEDAGAADLLAGGRLPAAYESASLDRPMAGRIAVLFVFGAAWQYASTHGMANPIMVGVLSKILVFFWNGLFVNHTLVADLIWTLAGTAAAFVVGSLGGHARGVPVRRRARLRTICRSIRGGLKCTSPHRPGAAVHPLVRTGYFLQDRARREPHLLHRAQQHRGRDP